ERQQIREELNRILPADPRAEAARDALAEHVKANAEAGQQLPDREPDDVGLSAEQRVERFDDLKEREAGPHLPLPGGEAELRGENGAHVLQAAALRQGLDEEWWQTASVKEIQAVYEHVEGWEDGQAKRGMLTQLQSEVFHHHGVDVGRDAAAEDV